MFLERILVMSIDKSTYFKCGCNSHILEVCRDEDFGTCLTIWKLNNSGGKFTFFERLRWCFHILKNGTPWGDEFILQEKDKEKLCEKIMES